MLNIYTKDLDLNTHETFELARAFYPDEEIVFNSDYSFNRIDICEDNNKYLLSLYRESKLLDREEIEVQSVNIYRDEKSTKKTALKKGLFFLFSRDVNYKLPWGILTGIRPVKIVEYLHSLGLSDERIYDVLIEEYQISDEKADLMMNVSRRQRPIIDSLKKNSYSLYVSIPFCPTRCLYCSFPTLTMSRYKDKVEGYLEAIKKEIIAIKEIMKDWEITTVYLGGGTPTSISVSQMESLIVIIKENFKDIKEFTIEAGRPDTINYEYLELFKKYRIDRISINPQTMVDSTLKLIGRQHNSQDIVETYKMAKEIGIPTVNMDLIIGLPDEGLKELQYTLSKIKELDPDNLTIHTLSLKKGSRFLNEKEKYNIKDSNEIEKMLIECGKFTKDMNLHPYYLYRQKQILGNFENVGYSKVSNPCLYNVSIMEEKETIIAVGMGGVSKFYNKDSSSIVRLSNFRDIDEYLSRVDELITAKKDNIINIEKGH